MEAKDFWERVDNELKIQNVSMTDLCKMIKVRRETIYTQRKRNQLPKYEQMKAMVDILGPSILDGDPTFDIFKLYLERAEEWQIKAVKKILDIPEV